MRSVVCFGCGDFGKYFLETYGEYLIIDYFLDNQSGKDMFYDYNRFLPSADRCYNKFIVVTNLRYYREIAAQLRGYGLTENSDFISLWEFEKKYPTIRRDLKTIKCWFVDFWEGFDIYNNYFIKSLRKYYNVVLDSEIPDLLFGSVFYTEKGPEAFHYSCVRIFYTGENLIPDFNIYDYAIGFDYIDYGDRYLRWPLYWFYQEDVDLARKKHLIYDIDRFMERNFCCRVVSGEKSQYREQVFETINERKYVASGGKCKNNMPNGKCVENKREFLSKYKFNLAMENANSPGYVTEKIIQAWAAGCIPIYWGGGGKIKDEFNKEAYIDCSDFHTTAELIDYLEYLEHDKDALKKILSAPVFLHRMSEADTALEAFLRNIVDKAEEDKIQRLSEKSIYAGKHEQMYLFLK